MGERSLQPPETGPLDVVDGIDSRTEQRATKANDGCVEVAGMNTTTSPEAPQGRRIEEISDALANPEAYLERIRVQRASAEADAAGRVRNHREQMRQNKTP